MSTQLNAKQFLEQEKRILLLHPLFEDQFIKTLSSLENFEKARAQRFALIYYPHILRTRLYQANALGICPDEQIQAALADILYDEYGEGDIRQSHMEQYRRFMRATGLDVPLNNETLEIIPELGLYISTMMRLSQSEHWIAAVAAVGVASEFAIPKYYGLLMQGLRCINGVSKEDLTLFEGHIELDIEHAQQVENAILPYLDKQENQAEFRRGIKVNMDARRVLHAGLYREVFT